MLRVQVLFLNVDIVKTNILTKLNGDALYNEASVVYKKLS